MGSKVKDRLQ